MGAIAATMAVPKLMLGVVVVVCALGVATADGEGVVALAGEDMPMANSDQQRLGESAGTGTRLTTASSFSGQASRSTFSYKVNAGPSSNKALMELRGQLLMGESSDVDSNEARVSVADLQSKLETYADVMGMVPRQTAVKALLSLQGAGSALPEELDQEELIQMEAKAVSGWGRRRRGATWDKPEAAPAKPTAKPATKPVPIVKKEAKKPIVEPTGSPKVDEAKTKAANAIKLAREKGEKATAKAIKEAKAAQKEARDKTAFELAEKRKQEVLTKQEKQKERKMKDSIERDNKKAKEAKEKQAVLVKAVSAAKAAANAEVKKEKEQKQVLEDKNEIQRRLTISASKESGGKKTKEAIDKTLSKNGAAHQAEMNAKKQEEAKMKHKHTQGSAKVKEVAKKKGRELTAAARTESKNKDAEEKALKHRDEMTAKNNHQKLKAAQKELKYKADSENREKKKREAGLKVAAKRRVDEEMSSKNDKRKSLATSAEQATKTAKESESKLEGEASQKVKDEVAHKKARERKQKNSKETIVKKESEIVRKVSREHADKVAQEKSAKKFALERHLEKKSKAHERIAKILGGLKAFSEKHRKIKAKFTAKNKLLSIIDPLEKTLKVKSKEAAKLAQELASKIAGKHGGQNSGNCDLSQNLEKLKTKGLLTGSDGKCSVTCTLKPSDIAIRAECSVDGHAGCRSFLYTRMQSLSSAMIAEFNSFKACGLSKTGEHVPTEEGMMLGEDGSDKVTVVPKAQKGGFSVGSYMYALRDMTHVDGTVSVAKAMDLMMKCHKDGKGKDTNADEVDELLGETYNPKKSQAYGDDKGSCSVKSITTSLSSIAPDKSDTRVQFSCETNSVDANNYVAECSGAGNAQAFLTKTEAFQRAVATTFLTWKTRCIAQH